MSDQQPNPPKREINTDSRSSLFTVASIIISLSFIAYGVVTLSTGDTNGWSMALALATGIYGFYSLAVVAYAYKRRGRGPVMAIQFGAAAFLIAFIFILSMNSLIAFGLTGGFFVCIGIWCNWIAVVKIVKQPLTPAAESSVDTL